MNLPRVTLVLGKAEVFCGSYYKVHRQDGKGFFSYITWKDFISSSPVKKRKDHRLGRKEEERERKNDRSCFSSFACSKLRAGSFPVYVRLPVHLTEVVTN